MRKNRGFTLIEVMVVLSILAIIAILAYNFFGSTMKEAKAIQTVTKVYNDMRTAADAIEMYSVKTGQPIKSDVGFVNFSDATFAGKLLSDGGLKAIPTPASGLVGSKNYSYETGGYEVIGSPTAANDDNLWADHLTDADCLEYNERYSSLGRVMWDWNVDGAGYTKFPAGPTACIDGGVATDDNSVIYVIETR